MEKCSDAGPVKHLSSTGSLPDNSCIGIGILPLTRMVHRIACLHIYTFAPYSSVTKSLQSGNEEVAINFASAASFHKLTDTENWHKKFKTLFEVLAGPYAS